VKAIHRQDTKSRKKGKQPTEGREEGTKELSWKEAIAFNMVWGQKKKVV